MFHSVSYAIFKALSQGPINGALSPLLLFKFRNASRTQRTSPATCGPAKEAADDSQSADLLRYHIRSIESRLSGEVEAERLEKNAKKKKKNPREIHCENERVC